mgnify:CR=1 FL=1
MIKKICDRCGKQIGNPDEDKEYNDLDLFVKDEIVLSYEDLCQDCINEILDNIKQPAPPEPKTQTSKQPAAAPKTAPTNKEPSNTNVQEILDNAVAPKKAHLSEEGRIVSSKPLKIPKH